MSKDEAASNPIGSGPYEFVKWDKGSQIVLKKQLIHLYRQILKMLFGELFLKHLQELQLIAGNVDMKPMHHLIR